MLGHGRVLVTAEAVQRALHAKVVFDVGLRGESLWRRLQLRRLRHGSTTLK